MWEWELSGVSSGPWHIPQSGRSSLNIVWIWRSDLSWRCCSLEAIQTSRIIIIKNIFFSISTPLLLFSLPAPSENCSPGCAQQNKGKRICLDQGLSKTSLCVPPELFPLHFYHSETPAKKIKSLWRLSLNLLNLCIIDRNSNESVSPLLIFAEQEDAVVADTADGGDEEDDEPEPEEHKDLLRDSVGSKKTQEVSLLNLSTASKLSPWTNRHLWENIS